MCAMCVMMDYGRQRVPRDVWRPDSWREFKDILRRIDRLDEQLGEPECHDPAKARWMDEIEERVRKLEERATQQGMGTAGA